jgi:DNA-binding MarR family transcriptional regulator
MPVSYYQVLAQLSEAPGQTLRMSELADATSSSRSRLSHAVGRLEAAGWVERRAYPTDGRGQVAVLIPQGLAVLEADAPGHVTAVRESLFDALSPEQVRELGRIFRQVIEGLRSRRPGSRVLRPAAQRTIAPADARQGCPCSRWAASGR